MQKYQIIAIIDFKNETIHKSRIAEIKTSLKYFFELFPQGYNCITINMMLNVFQVFKQKRA